MPVKVDLRHDQLPDPVPDMILNLSNQLALLDERIERIERALEKGK
jgi:hypothetical protein